MAGGRGGARPGAGRKRKPLADRIVEGKTKNITVLSRPAPGDYTKTPLLRGCLSAMQLQFDRPLGADAIFMRVWQWLNMYRCAEHVEYHRLEAYAILMARFHQCHDLASSDGLLEVDARTQSWRARTYLSIGRSFFEQANVIWREIEAIIKQNSSVPYADAPRDDVLEQILAGRWVEQEDAAQS